MRKTILVLLFALVNVSAWAQIQDHDPIKWNTQVKKTAQNEYDLIFTATLEQGWHVYSQFIPEGGPIPTQFIFNKGKYEKQGKVEEKGQLQKIHDEGFDMDLTYFSGSCDFVQHVKLTGPTDKITGTYEYMICNDEMCLPPNNKEFSFPVQYEYPTGK
jgi:thiol:disulfide interchange protein DsbD